MAPNPIIIPRHRPSTTSQSQHGRKQDSGSLAWRSRKDVPLTLLFISGLLLGFLTHPKWTNKWVWSGAAIETALIIISAQGSSIRLRLAFLNLAFLVFSSSWVLLPFFSTACYGIAVVQCITSFPIVSSGSRRLLRKALPSVCFFEDKIAVFDIPALQIDTEVNGLFVVRGLTISLLDFRIEAQGIELGLRLNNEVELALCTDHLTVHLLRQIEMSDVYGNLKINDSEMFFEAPTARAAETSESRHPKSPPLLTDLAPLSDRRGKSDLAQVKREKTSHGSRSSSDSDYSAPQALNDVDARKSYNQFLKQVEHTSQIHLARKQINQGRTDRQPRSEKEMRQAICAKLQDVPTISHTPAHAVKVSTLQTILPRVRRFLHRFPLLLRLLLNPLSYFHPVRISTVSVAGPGEQLQSFLESFVNKFQNERTEDGDIEQFREEMSSWLSNASFCLEIANLSALGHVPLDSGGEITTYARSGNVGVYRTPLDSNTVTQVTHIGGVDATCVIPAFLLPHHEHVLPPEASKQVGNDSSLRSENEEHDVTHIILSAHASLPTHFDQSLLDFAAALLKATKMIDLENLFERENSGDQSSEQNSTSSMQSEVSDSYQKTTNNENKDDAGGRSTLRSKIASRVYHSAKDGLKKGTMVEAVGNKVNDRWVMKTVSRIAARLEQAHGDFGYTTHYPVDLAPYRPKKETPSKILP